MRTDPQHQLQDETRVGLTARLVEQGKITTSRFLTFPVSNMRKRRYAELAMFRLVRKKFPELREAPKKYSLRFPVTEYDNLSLRLFSDLGWTVPDYKKWTKAPDPIPLYSGLLKFADPLPAPPADEQDIRTLVHDIVRELLPVKVRPYTFEDVTNHLDLSTSAGYLRNCKKGDVIDSGFYRELDYYIKHVTDLSSNPCKFATKGRLSEIQAPKSRLIWIYPIEHVFIEGIMAYPMYEYLKTHETAMHFGFKSIERLKQNLASITRGYRVTTDWSGFDQHVPNWLLSIVLDELFKRLDLKRWSTPNARSGITAPYLHRLMELTRRYFIDTPFVLPDGGIFFKHHGVPSGSPFTQLVDTIVNMTMVRYTLIKLGVHWKADEYLGDDATFATDLPFYQFVAPFAQIAKETFGAILSVKKTTVTNCECEDATFLGYVVHHGGIFYDAAKLPLYLIVANDCADNPQLTWIRLLGFAATGASSVDWFLTFARAFLRRHPESVYYDEGLLRTYEGRYIQSKLKYVLGVSDASLKASLDAALAAGARMIGRNLPLPVTEIGRRLFRGAVPAPT